MSWKGLNKEQRAISQETENKRARKQYLGFAGRAFKVKENCPDRAHDFNVVT